MQACNSRWESNRDLKSSQPAHKPVFDGKISQQSAKILVFKEEAPGQSAKSFVPNKRTSDQYIISSIADCGFDEGSQPPGRFTDDVKVHEHVNTRVSRRA